MRTKSLNFYRNSYITPYYFLYRKNKLTRPIILNHFLVSPSQVESVRSNKDLHTNELFHLFDLFLHHLRDTFVKKNFLSPVATKLISTDLKDHHEKKLFRCIKRI